MEWEGCAIVVGGVQSAYKSRSFHTVSFQPILATENFG